MAKSVSLPKRNQNLELLRILAMIFIILHHLIAHGMKNVGYFPYPIEGICLEKQIPLILLNAFTVVSVNCFILISGYFGIKPTKKKMCNLFIICTFYSVLIYAIFSPTFHYKTFIYTFSPFSHNQGLWFVTCYIGLFLISPMLNAAVNYLNTAKDSEWIKVLCGGGIITFYFGYLWKTDLNYNGSNLINFIFLYMIGRYLYVKNTIFQAKIKKYFIILVYLICTLITASIAVFFLLSKGTADYIFYWAWRYNSPFVILGSVALFMFFNSLTIKGKRWINTIAASTFSVYLIHENYIVRNYYINYVESIPSDMNIVNIVFILLIVALVVFCGCIIIDLIRRFLFENKYMGKLKENCLFVKNTLCNKNPE